MARREVYLTSPYNHAFAAHLFKAIFKQHHKENLPLLRRFIPCDGVVFDVGAHAGQHAKLFARIAEQGFVFAVEPGSYARTILRFAIACNRIRNIGVLPLALGDAAAVATIHMPLKKSGSYGFGLSHLGASTRESKRELVAVATLDAVVSELGLTRLDFIKIDIEGFEVRLLRGAGETLRRLKPVLLLEMDWEQVARAGDRLEDGWRLLEAVDYRPYSAVRTNELEPVHEPAQGTFWWLPPGKADADLAT